MRLTASRCSRDDFSASRLSPALSFPPVYILTTVLRYIRFEYAIYITCRPNTIDKIYALVDCNEVQIPMESAFRGRKSFVNNKISVCEIARDSLSQKGFIKITFTLVGVKYASRIGSEKRSGVLYFFYF